ncbi:Na/Pi cotransporter family protein [Labrys sp. KNU-23]|uniref:Na/Pi cotransporter family protein n=1 Tax=Labrys sp. KNU-23 TaxID=2789216 RepID=UPI0011EF8ECA|nr:Na/Pi cotransporter family protein [Labrys sp. KNU-23]QEN86607.1 Na/Pi cotransporter family protein [Labrys sp. KNU-23]
MAGQHVFLNLLAGIALLIWSTRLVKTGIMRAFGERLRGVISRATSNRFSACLAGAGVAAALQSSTGSTLLVMSFVERGFLTLAVALAVLLGSNVGTTLVVQALSFDLSALMPVLIIAGVASFMLGRSSVSQNVGRAMIGLGLMILSLHLVVGIAEPIRQSEIMTLIFERLNGQPWAALLIGAALAWLVHSSVAILLLVMSLAGAGVVGIPLGFALVLGANIGSGLAPLGLSLAAPIEVRRALLGNLGTRLAGAVVLLPLIGLIQPWLAQLEASGARQIANFHVGFNLLLLIVFLPFIDQTARLLERLVRAPEAPIGERPSPVLDEGDFDSPSVALVAASREVIRLAELVEIMLRESIITFEEQDDSRRKQISQLDYQVDRLQENIKLYLTRLTRTPLDKDMSRKAFELILFTTNLEHVGDILDKTLLELAAKKQRLNLSFSSEGWAEIKAMHREVVAQMRLAITVFMTQDPVMARQLVVAKDQIRNFERSAAESHLNRLRAGTLASIETSSLHMDVIRDLKRIVAHLTAVAYPILEAAGELSTSRLKDAG